jgi:broad specificity phosphatase PhoE
MLRLLLIRHTEHDLIHSTIAARMPGVHLNETGRQNATRLAEALARTAIDAIYSSPMERSIETAQPLADRLGLELTLAPAINELEVGDWTGKNFAEIQDDATWKLWNTFRTQARPPNGESILEVQARAVGFIESLGTGDRCVALFSHGDVIRAALCHFFGLHLDFIMRFEIDPGRVSVVEIFPGWSRVRTVNALATGWLGDSPA